MSDDLVKRLRGDWDGCDVSLKAIGAMEEAADRIEALTAERDEARLGNHCGNEHEPTWAELTAFWKSRAEKAEADNARLRKAAIALRGDMLERSQLRIDAINGEQYRIVNAGAGVWMDFCAALNGKETNGL